jgi:hypothetical protein
MKERTESVACERGNDLVSFLYHELDERELRGFQKHLNDCSSCSGELASFQGIRSSVAAWREQSLGMATVASSMTSKIEKPSALAAIRQFFALSPLLLKGAVAFASLLFFAVVAFLLVNLNTRPAAPLVHNDKVYSEEEMRAKVDAEIQARLNELNRANNNSVKEPQPQLAVASPPKSKAKTASYTDRTRRAPLTRSEREQLAADLRLISPTEDSDLNLLGEQINR